MSIYKELDTVIADYVGWECYDVDDNNMPMYECADPTLAENITEAIEKLQNEECITMHIVSVNEKTNIADVDIPLRNSNWGWGMGYVMAA